MGDDNAGHPPVHQPADDRQHLVHHGGVQGRGGLVKEDDLRLHCHAPGNGGPLLLASGELGGHIVRPLRHTHLGQALHGQVDGILFGQALELHGGHHHVLQHRLVGKQVEGLVHHAHLPADLVQRSALGGDLLAVDKYSPPSGLLQQIDAAQECALSAAGGPNDRDTVPFFNVYIDVLKYKIAAEALGKALDMNYRHQAASFRYRCLFRSARPSMRLAIKPSRR